MPWHEIEGHDRIVEEFRRAIGRGRLASTFLFAGPAGIGKRTFAVKLAQALLCQTRPESLLDPCGQCPSCVQVTSGTHPDLDIIVKPEGKSTIPIDLLVGDREHRRQEGLCHNLGLKPTLGGRKIAIIDDSDFLNAEGANALLKTLEEPPPRSVLILIGTSPAKQLPTIRSRCQLIRFRPLPIDTVASILLQKGLAADSAEAARLARYSEGSVARAQELSDPALWTFRHTLHEALASPAFDSVHFAPTVSSFIDEAGKDAPLRRARFRQVVLFAADFYRQLLLAQTGAASSADQELQTHVARAVRAGMTDRDATAARLDRCLDATAQIDRNANQASLVDAWLADLSR